MDDPFWPFIIAPWLGIWNVEFVPLELFIMAFDPAVEVLRDMPDPPVPPYEELLPLPMLPEEPFPPPIPPPEEPLPPMPMPKARELASRAETHEKTRAFKKRAFILVPHLPSLNGNN